jgi:hypothetical protein
MSTRTAVSSRVTAIAVVALVLAGAVPVAGAGPVAVDRITVAGPGVVTGGDQPSVAAWRPVDVTASVETGSDAYDVCFGVTDAGQSIDLGCQRIIGANARENVTVTLDRMPENVTGTQQLTVSVRRADVTTSRDEPLAQASRSVRVLTAAGDLDDDGLGNRRELTIGTDHTVPDTDGDGLDDGPEVNTYETDPTDTDTDGDGLADGVEVNDQGTNPTEMDTDGDGLDDGVEVTTHGTDPTSTDTDDDGLADGPEVNVHQTSPTKADTDGDGLDDGPEVNVHETDPTAPDTDGDGLDDAAEVERYGTNPTEADTDGDGLVDGREVNQLGTDPTRADTDGDGKSDSAEIANGSDPTSGGSDGFGTPDVDPTVVVALVVGISLALGGVFVHRRGESLLGNGDDGSDHSDGSADDTEDATVRNTSMHSSDALSDEQRVHALVDDRGGRVRQSVIVEETGWSKSKVSRVLSEMADEGSIEKITIGRENLIAHPDSVPEGAGSPFEPTESE